LPNTVITEVERRLARAHYQLFMAHQAASTLRTDSLSDDLWAHLREIEKLQAGLAGDRKS
jgi:hypothetical protein